VAFEEDTPERLISSLLPDVLVKGADYRSSEIAGAAQVLAAGGEVCTIELVDGVSSTAILTAGNATSSTNPKEINYAH
jgi:D-beta-D-heptose 7-phosphate kinase/D-beta-D-heptose 1-phosphate adenosyltransferase